MTTYSFPSVQRDGITLIIGLGETGVAAARWCARNGASLRIADTRSTPAGLQALTDRLDTQNIELCLGPDVLTDAILDGHGGGDGGIVRVLYKYLTEDYNGDMLSEIGISVQNHMIAFAAETSRKENRVVKMSEFGY